MRTTFPAVVFLFFVATHNFAQTHLLSPLSSEQPVSDPSFAPAAEQQGLPRVATNGDIALAVSADERSGALTTYAVRISGDAIALDPLAIPLAVGGAPEAVVWNGAAFLVVIAHENFREIVFESPDGRIVDRKPLAISNSYRFAAALSGGPEVRLLFVGPSQLVVDGHGNVTEGDKIPLPGVWIATGSDSEFLVVGYGYPASFASYRFSFDGKLLGIAASKLPIDSMDGTEALASGGSGFLLVQQKWIDPKVIAYRLDSNGVFTNTMLLAAADPSDRRFRYHPSIIREAERWIVSWDSSLQTGRAFVYTAGVAFGGEAGPVHLVSAWDGITLGSSLISGPGSLRILTAVDRLFTSTNVDVFAQTLSDALDAGPPQVTATSATLQTNSSIALSNYGYAVMWSEIGPDRYTRLNVRRFSDAGVPFDGAAVELMAQDQDFTNPPLPFGSVISNGETYLFAWPDIGGWRARRMSARTGEWLDSRPFEPGFGITTFASNGADVLAICSAGSKVFARRIAMSGDPLASPIVTISNSGAPYSVTLASNGRDYLAAWSDGVRDCSILCTPFPPFRLLAMRLQADGSPIDAAPIILEQENSYPDLPSVAWNDGHYFLAWSDADGVRGAFVSAEGVISGRVPLEQDQLYGSMPKVLALGGGFVLLTETLDYSHALLRPVLWEGVTFPAGVNLSEVAGMPRAPFVRFENYRYDSFAADARGSRLFAAYNSAGDRSLGSVARVVVRAFGEAPKRRRIVRR